MEQAIVTSEVGFPKRTYVLLTLNILGVVACLFSIILLILWGACVIWPEPDTSAVILQFIRERSNSVIKKSRHSNETIKGYADETISAYMLV
ncbi:hypothetical protein K1T71_003141 [Dendrolimus kikuchii]|uniref:Uncharacterized protein n=1 Tax=Dendrolimus kikuchii TaxID=765133 RepID=A0ACC1DB73_9NEOP|nr:hypothetical protein K1T71_003141 [Dendrolimus kikuchii]